MDIKKSNFLKDCFKLSSFSLNICNVNAGNRCYASLRFCEFCPQRGENPLNSKSKRGYIEKYVRIIYGCEVRRMNRSRSFAVLFDKLSRVERPSRPKYKSAILIDGFQCDVIKL